jgi:hypothetical protein
MQAQSVAHLSDEGIPALGVFVGCDPRLHGASESASLLSCQRVSGTPARLSRATRFDDFVLVKGGPAPTAANLI